MGAGLAFPPPPGLATLDPSTPEEIETRRDETIEAAPNEQLLLSTL